MGTVVHDSDIPDLDIRTTTPANRRFIIRPRTARDMSLPSMLLRMLLVGQVSTYNRAILMFITVQCRQMVSLRGIYDRAWCFLMEPWLCRLDHRRSDSLLSIITVGNEIREVPLRTSPTTAGTWSIRKRLQSRCYSMGSAIVLQARFASPSFPKTSTGHR